MSSSIRKQKALFLKEKFGEFVVGERGVPPPGKGQLLVKVHAAALNPVDYKIQQVGLFVQDYPAVLGVDFAGVVEDVGEDVQGFSKGDRVFSHGEFVNDQSAYQHYALATADFAAKIPSSISFDHAATVPLGLDTAAVGLYSSELGAGLVPPWTEDGRGKYAGKPILILGGSSSVGAYAIQLARLSGFSPIITTASPAHQDTLEALGATDVIDRHLTENEFAAALEKITQQPIDIAYDAISVPRTQSAAWSALARGGILVLTLRPSVQEDEGKNRSVIATYGNPHSQPNQSLCRGLWRSIERWLQDGVIKPNNLEVLPNGLEGILDGLERLKAGKVSGIKLVAHPLDTV